MKDYMRTAYIGFLRELFKKGLVDRKSADIKEALKKFELTEKDIDDLVQDIQYYPIVVNVEAKAYERALKRLDEVLPNWKTYSRSETFKKNEGYGESYTLHVLMTKAEYAKLISIVD